jgi:septal ring factor EnvC (AmiA/AmiB activator)
VKIRKRAKAQNQNKEPASSGTAQEQSPHIAGSIHEHPGNNGSTRHPKGTLQESVRGVLVNMQPEFSRGDVLKNLQSKGVSTKAKYVGLILDRLASMGDVVMVKHGKGSSPSVYRRKE